MHYRQDISVLRQQLRARRRAVEFSIAQQAAQQVLQQLLHFSLIKNWQHIAVYLASEGEIDPHLFVEWCWQQGKNCYLPVLSPDKNKTMQFVHYTSHSILQPNRYHILEPVNEPIIALKELDAVLLPLVAFDKSGNRLGRGGGFYDVTLANVKDKPFLLGLAYAFQAVDELPVKSTDVALHGVVTEYDLLAF